MKKIIFLVCVFFTMTYANQNDIKALHLVLRGDENISKMEEIIILAKKNNFNTIILMIANGIQLDSLSLVHKKKLWTKKEFKEFIKFIKNNKLEIIPEIKLLTHQQSLFEDIYPEYMLNKTTYNTNNENVYKHVFNIIDEVVNLTNCKTLHIGHDEVAGNHRHIGRKWITLYEKFNGKVLTPEEYLKDIIKIYMYLKNKNIKTMIWGDMLLNPESFPTMLKRNLNGTSGFDSIIEQLPKDIIIGDWHYFDEKKEFPSYMYFIKKGFTVYGAFWENKITTKNFINYIKSVETVNSKGYIQTTWYNPSYKKFNTVNNLIKYSGKLLNEK